MDIIVILNYVTARYIRKKIKAAILMPLVEWARLGYILLYGRGATPKWLHARYYY